MLYIIINGAILGIGLFLLIILLRSFHSIGPTQIGLVIKTISFKKLPDENPIAFHGEAGYQAKLLMPGIRFIMWPFYRVKKYPWIQVPANEIGVVISQVGKSLPTGAKSANYKSEMGDFSRLEKFIQNGGEKGVQRPVLLPGTLSPVHPIGFLVITKKRVYGEPIDPKLKYIAREKGGLTCVDFGLQPEQLDIVRIAPSEDGRDMIGIVTTHDGDPLDAGDIANRLGGFNDIAEMEQDPSLTNSDLVEIILGSKNKLHNNYQDFQTFINSGGKIGLQHDPLLYGSYAINPFLVSVEIVPMLVVEQGQVAVIKSYVGLVTKDISGDEFKFGSLVRPGHRGIWQEPLRTGKFPINPRCYQPVIVPTSILTLNWADVTSKAHDLDKQLRQIDAKSKEGFEFAIDLQVQIHVSDKKAPLVISMVGTMQNLIDEVLQAAVGNHFRDKLQSMKAIEFIERRQAVQEDAYNHILNKLEDYKVETRGVYIQDVVLPKDLVQVLTEREIASQEVETFKMQEKAQQQRIEMERKKGTAEMQSDLAASEVDIQIKENKASARISEAKGESTYISKLGEAKGIEVKATGLAKAEAYREQVNALGPQYTALVNAVTALANGTLKLPEILTLGGGGSSIEGLLSMFMKNLNIKNKAEAKQAVGEVAAEPAKRKADTVPVAVEPVPVQEVADEKTAPPDEPPQEQEIEEEL